MNFSIAPLDNKAIKKYLQKTYEDDTLDNVLTHTHTRSTFIKIQAVLIEKEAYFRLDMSVTSTWTRVEVRILDDKTWSYGNKYKKAFS